MGIFKKIAWTAAGVTHKVERIKQDIETRNNQKHQEVDKKNAVILAKKHKYLPRIKQIAGSFKASVDPSDTKAYIYKMVDGNEKGVTITYGESEDTIQLKLERAFTQRSTATKIFKKITSVANKAKEARESMGEAGKAIHDALGEGSSMYDDPNFGGAFREGSVVKTSRHKTNINKKKPRSGKTQSQNRDANNDLYPEIVW